MKIFNLKNSIRFLKRNDGDINRKIIRSGFWVGISNIGVTSLSFLRSIILARLLTPEIFGLMSICMVAIRGLEFFSQTGFSAALVHRQENFQEAKDTAFILLILRGFCLAIITFLIAPLMANYYENRILDNIIKILALSFIFKGFYNINAIELEKNLNFKRLTYIEQSATLINFIMVVFLAYYLRNIWALVIGQLASSLIDVLLSYGFIQGKPHIRFDKKIAKELFSYGKFITGLTIILFITVEIDNLVIGKVLGMENLGYYVIAFTIANLPATHISKIISKIMFPAFSQLQNDLQSLRKLYLTTIDLIAKIALPASFGIAVLADEIITILYGNIWANSIEVLKILIFLAAIRAISSANGYVYNAIGKPQIPFYINFAKLVCILIIVYPLTAQYGIVGTAIAMTIPHVIFSFVSVYIFNHVIKLDLLRYIYILSRNIACSLIMCIFIYLTKPFLPINNIFILCLYIFYGVFLYALLNLNFIINTIKFRAYPSV